MLPGQWLRATLFSPHDVVARDSAYQKSQRGLFPEQGLIAVIWTLFAVAAVITFLRCFVRFSENHHLFTDDYWIILAVLFLLVIAVLQTLQTPDIYALVHLGPAVTKLDGTEVALGTHYRALAWPIIGIFWTIVWCVKASFLALFYRLYTQLPGHRRLWWAVAVFTGLAYIGCWMSLVFTCHPPSTFFHFRRSSLLCKSNGYAES